MGFISEVIGYPLGFIMWAVYSICKNYGISIILFTILTKAMLWPLSVKQEKSLAKTASFSPKVEALKKMYGNNKEKFQQEQMKLYSEEGISPMGSCLPMLIQFPILFGIIDVVYKPLTHILRFSKETIESASEVALKVLETAGVNVQSFAGRPQLFILQAFNTNPDAFSGIESFSEKMTNFDLKFLFGIFDLGQMPTLTFPIMLIPILSGVSQLALTIYNQKYQKKINPNAQSMGAMNIMLYFMPLFSVWFAFQVPAGVGFYWIMQSVVMFAQTVILKKIYTPEKMAIIAAEEKSKKKAKGPSYMDRVLEKQKELQKQNAGGGATVNAMVKRIETTKSTDSDNAEPSEKKISKKDYKDMSSKVIADARKRYAEKYGDDIEEE